MRILGHERLKRRSEAVQIGSAEDGSPAVLTLYAPSLGAIERILAEFRDALGPEPIAPVAGGVKRGPRGEPLLDDRGQPVPNRNEQDPGYVARQVERAQLQARVNRAQSLALILECAGDQIEHGLAREAFGSAIEFYETIMVGLGQAGLDAAAFAALSRAAVNLTGVSKFEVDQARAALVQHPGN